MPKPLRELLRMRLKAVSKRGSMFVSSDFAFFAELFFLRLRFRHNFVELRALQIEVLLTDVERFVAAVQVALLEFDETFGLANLLFQQFDLQALEFDLLREVIVFAVVAHIVELLLVARHHFLGGADVFVLASDVRLDRLDFFFVLLETVGQSFDLVFQILHFERKFAAQGLDLVDFRKFSLQLVEVFNFCSTDKSAGFSFLLAIYIVEFNRWEAPRPFSAFCCRRSEQKGEGAVCLCLE